MVRLICHFPILGNISIDIQDNNLGVFTKRQLTNYIVSETTIDTKGCFVSIEIENKENIAFDDIIFGREIKFKNNNLNISKNSRIDNINYKYFFDKNIRIDIVFKKKLAYYLKDILNSEYSQIHMLFYKTILYPIFSLYALVDNYYLVHGSLLRLEDKNIVLTGLDGVGKSSLSNELVLNGAKILADNFVLFNGKDFIGLNMPIRLDLKNETTKNIIFKDDNLKEVLYNDKENNQIKVDKIYFLNISNNLKIEQIDSDIVKLNWNFINNGASEIMGANSFCLPFLYQNMINNKQKIDTSIEYFNFSIPKGKIKEATKELMCL